MTTILFMGTPQFAVPILRALDGNPDYQVLAVVTQPDKPVGRKRTLTASPVKLAAQELKLPVYQPEKLTKSPELAQLIALAPDLIVTAAFGQFLPKSLLAAAKIMPVNVHGSLLPQYRGGAPIQRAIMNGDTETGVTIMEMVSKMDAGDMFSQVKVPIAPRDTSEDVFAKLSLAGRDLLLETLPKIISGSIVKVPQDPEKVTIAPNIAPEEEQLDLNLTALQLTNKVRALNPDPVAYLAIGDQRIKIWASHQADLSTSLEPGHVVKADKKNLWLAAGSGSVWAIDRLQLAGKKEMSINDFMNGNGRELVAGQKVIEA
ncbi:methionyl-tRNA formyltransferase [Lapidilactobacillus concavus DSM 17758]|uniref:Methionyl-tRNA formyltransferase n=1 Tax=Lapidilactobacillus concavus DSM 17758 TaxID=1423735 RepID=A0A0R1W7W6_9LACO|nr:methionyl-tRNA formyltransferase [Lapidilactobacillus concavus]KRM13815.1 methionyl-tRNA formyltransferase [Lapidilactobacillus concavus DSM 17758]GEL12699.1 methionyl-tRNA formyltransferase [Lapidilactobacillus concavus]